MMKEKSFFRKHMVLISVIGVFLILTLVGVFVYYNPPDVLLDFVIRQGIKLNQQKPSVFEDDGLYVITTGTGAPLPEKGRAGPQTVVVAGEQVLVFDAGPGSTLNLVLSGISPDDISGLFLTHFHSDHIGDIGELALKYWTANGSDVPLQVYGPPGVQMVIDGFEQAYVLDRGYRIDHHGEETMPPSGFGFEVHPFDLGSDLMSSQTVYKSGEVEVIAFNVNHLPVFPAVGYRVNYKGRSVVITGDTIYTESLTHHAKGADTLVSEALNHKYSQMVSDSSKDMGSNVSVVAKDIKTYHIRPDEVGIVANDAEVSQVIITHILPPIPSNILKNAFLRGMKETYSGSVYIANDGTLIKMPVGSDEIFIKELL